MAKQTEYIGPYKILERIGEGGMAYIYKALQPSLKRTVVIKKLKDPNREIIKRFKKEALLSASFHHQNLISIYDFIFSNRNYYLVMEHVEGEDLRTIIDHLAPFPPQIAALIALSIARGLEYTHARNIIHRDIKPSNILVGYDGSVKLIDFGIARDDLSTRLTVTGMIVGTPAYMSPEQANGDTLTPKSDLFSLGILLYEMLTGIKPFEGTNQSEVIAHIIRGNYRPIQQVNPTIPHRLQKIVKKCLRHAPQKRYHTATELINDLERFLPWQVRNQQKRIMARFLNGLDKNQPSGVQTVIPDVMVRFSTRKWFVFKSLLAALSLFGAVLLFSYLQKKHIGYVHLRARALPYHIRMDLGRPQNFMGPEISLPPFLQGKHVISIFNQDTYAPLECNFTVQPGKILQLKLPVNSPDTLSRVQFFTKPKGVQIYLDGDSLGIAPLRVDSLNPGLHHVLLRKKGFRNQTVNIRCYAGQWQRYLFVLDPEKE